MASELPTPTPEISGDNKAATNSANNQGENKPIRKVTRPHRKPPKKFLGLTESKRRELFGIIMLIPWVWVEFGGIHSFGNLCGLAFSLAVAQYVVFSFFKVRLKEWTLPLWLISLAPIAMVVWVNSRPPPLVIISPTHIHLHTGTSEIVSQVFINNPNEYPVFSVYIMIVIDGNRIPANSVKIKIRQMDTPPEIVIHGGPGGSNDTYFSLIGVRFDGTTKTDGKSATCLVLDSIPPQSAVTLAINGTIPSESSARILLDHFSISPTETLLTSTNSLEFKIVANIPLNVTEMQILRHPATNSELRWLEMPINR